MTLDWRGLCSGSCWGYFGEQAGTLREKLRGNSGNTIGTRQYRFIPDGMKSSLSFFMEEGLLKTKSRLLAIIVGRLASGLSWRFDTKKNCVNCSDADSSVRVRDGINREVR